MSDLPPHTFCDAVERSFPRDGQPRVITGDATVAAFPLGGIGTGNVSIGARGDLRDWELFNSPAKGNQLPFTFFALHASAGDQLSITRILESRLRPPHQFPNGYLPGRVAGFPRFHESTLRGEYPFVWVDFIDDDIPLSVSLEAFTPLVPLDSDASGLPTAVLRYRIRNHTSHLIEATIVGSLTNPIGLRPGGTGFGPEIAGQPSNDFRSEQGLHGLYLASSLPSEDLRTGTITLATAANTFTAKPDWPAPFYGTIGDFWQDLRADGRLDFTTSSEAWDVPLARSASYAESNPSLKSWYEALQTEALKWRVGSLGIVENIQPGEEAVFEFVLAWHFPNRPRGWLDSGLDSPNGDEVVRNYYATRYDDAWAVAGKVIRDLPSLEQSTREFHDALHNSSLPEAIRDAAAAGVATLRSTTCFRLEDGTLAGWEGSNDHAGSWSGSCTHVWNYAQTAAFLFPDLERSMRRVEFALETEPDGRMHFRTNRIFGGTPFGFVPAVDGQLGTIVRLYRDWKFSGDDSFLRDLWPKALKALHFALEYWDLDGDAVLDAGQHTTYDVEFHGATSYANSILYAALLAVANMAEYLGDTEEALRCRELAARGADTMDRMLWNGEYYVQGLDDVNAYPYQCGDGCMANQVFGQLLAHIVGLGYVLPLEHIRGALCAIVRNNFIRDFSMHENALRTFVLGDEAGLINCSWPHESRRPARPFFFHDEVWTGTEYQVAAHLIYEGLVDEGVEVVRAVRRRHDGYRRSPWNEVEAGNHYARSMSSWALLLAYSGLRYDAQKQAISFAPVERGDDFRCFFSTGTGWGVFEQDRGGAELGLRYGSLRLSQLDLPILVASASVNGSVLPVVIEADQGGTRLTFDAVDLACGDVVRCERQ